MMFDLLLHVVIVLLVSKRNTRMHIQVFWNALQVCMQRGAFSLGNRFLTFRRV
jgi:hypothetical protein